jgi:cytochrome c
MKKLSVVLSALVFCTIFVSCGKQAGKPRILVFSKTAAFYHASIPAGIQAIQKLGAENGIEVDTTKNADWFTEDSLKKYAAVVFLSTTGNVLNAKQEIAFERYIQAGGGYIGVHAASDTEYDWGWYGRLVGGYFQNHPAVQTAAMQVLDKNHPSTGFLPDRWERRDEWYNYKNLNKDVKVLINLDEKSYEGGKNGDNHPIAWYHAYDGGRAFYTGLGHTEESFTSDSLFLKHLLGGIQYAVGENNEINWDRAHSEYPPDEDRFSKTVLTQGTLFEPTELTVLPNLDILVAQRRGEIMLLSSETKAIKQVGFLPVYFKASVPNVNAEEGVLGIQADPDFKKNNFIYIYYSPADTPVNRLSRFEFRNNMIDMKTEKVILQLYSQREICCHTGGSIAFGPDRIMYLSTGDNSTPFNQPGQAFVNRGFAPLDNRTGFEQYDARRTASNTNDLRGKILRIKIRDDGSYEIPEGNLFAKNTTGTKPEIFVMGNRNPYRISVDQKTGFLYWGEVGPDAREDSNATRGPRGYDEINQARKAGYYGWPLFVGNNFPYREYDFSKGTSGNSFNPEKPVNASKNNSGLQELPAAEPAFIWYGYDASNQFPQVGSGGRTAMAGPVYYSSMFQDKTRYPDYYDGKLFIYEWVRGWIKVVTMQKNGDFDKMEPFMEHTKFAAPMDMEVGPDGRLYILEYGNGWFSKNPDAGVSRIDFNSGNRPPVIQALNLSRSSGSLPFKVTATVTARDPENDKLRYFWDLGNGVKKETTEPSLEVTYDKTGDFTLSVEVADEKKATSGREMKTLYAGNEAPEVSISLESNNSFYFTGRPVMYHVQVKDPGNSNPVDISKVQVLADFVEGADKAAVPMGHLSLSETDLGKNLVFSGDCKACHQLSSKSVGPSFTEVAAKYKNDPKAATYLADKIVKGGGGVWGEVSMSAHPNLPSKDLQQMVKWILSLSQAEGKKKSLPPSGTILPSAKDSGLLYLTASYTDDGELRGVKSLSGKKTITLRSNVISLKEADQVTGFAVFDSTGTRYLALPPKGEGSLRIDSIDLAGIGWVELTLVSPQVIPEGYSFELRLDGTNGTKYGEASLPGNVKTTVVKIPVESPPGHSFHDIYLKCLPRQVKTPGVVRLKQLRFLAR